MRVRLRFTKLGKVRWTSHRDVARMWERAVRRVGLPVAYTEGFTPRPKVSFGLALSTGHESLAEYLDIAFATDDLDVAALPGRLTPALPAGIDVVAASAVEARAGSLQEEVTSTEWHLEAVGAPQDELRRAVDEVLSSSEIMIERERKGVTVREDVRPGILAVEVVGASPCVAEGYDAHAVGALLRCELATQPRGLRPAELLAACREVGAIVVEEGHVRRLHQWIERDGARREPLPVGATHAPHATERAS